MNSFVGGNEQNSRISLPEKKNWFKACDRACYIKISFKKSASSHRACTVKS